MNSTVEIMYKLLLLYLTATEKKKKTNALSWVSKKGLYEPQLFEVSPIPKDHDWCYFQHYGQTLASVCLASQIPYKFLTVIQPGLFTKSKSLENLLLQKI